MVDTALDAIRRYADRDVRVRLHDGSTFSGRLRSELVSDSSLSVYIAIHAGEGVTLYIDQIAEIVPLDASASR
jgi:hypothetical protein